MRDIQQLARQLPKYSFVWFCVLFMAAGTSCNTQKSAVSAHLQTFKYGYCAPSIAYEGYAWQDTTTAVLPQCHMAAHDRLLCRILGISNYVNHLSGLASDSQGGYNRMALEQQIAARVSLAQTELEAVASELDCEGQRANLAATYLDNLNSTKNKMLTTASVVAGAFTAVATALVSGKGAQTATGVGGGLLSAGLALITISPKGKGTEFRHVRNLLKSIWQQQAEDTAYPFFVWQMLHEATFSNSGKITLANSIRNRWLQFEFNGKIGRAQEALLFGAGGYYHADDLHTRSRMLNQLQATVRSINQDMASLVAFIYKM